MISGILSKMFADVAVPKWVIACLAAVCGYFFPDASQREAACTCFAFVMLDTLTGVTATVWEKKNGISNEPISSARFSRVVVKLLSYFSTVCVVVGANHNIPGAKQYQGASVTLVLVLILATEGISVLENCKRMGFTIPLGLDVWLQERLKNAGGTVLGEGENHSEKASSGD